MFIVFDSSKVEHSFRSAMLVVDVTSFEFESCGGLSRGSCSPEHRTPKGVQGTFIVRDLKTLNSYGVRINGRSQTHRMRLSFATAGGYLEFDRST